MKKTTLAAVAALASALACQPALAEIKIGFSAPLSGGQAAVGQDQLDGFQLALHERDGKLGGVAATVIREDDQLKPDVGSQIVRKFVERDRVDAIVGLGFSNVLMAGLKTIVDSGTVAIATNAGPSLVAGAGCAPNVFSAAWQNDGAAEGMGKYVQDKGFKRVYLMAPNYQAGKDMIAGFKRFYQGEVVDEVYTQVGQTDYSAEIAQLQAAGPDAVFVFYPGGMGVNYLKQVSQAGLLARTPVFSVFTVDGTTMPALREAAVGSVYSAMWDAGLQTPRNQAFVKAFEQRYQRVPSEYAATAYDAALILDAAVGKLGGNVADKKAFAQAVKEAGGTIESVRGPFAFNNNHMPIQNYYTFEVRQEGGKPVVVETGVALADHKDAYHGQCKAG